MSKKETKSVAQFGNLSVSIQDTHLLFIQRFLLSKNIFASKKLINGDIFVLEVQNLCAKKNALVFVQNLVTDLA